MPPKLLCPFAEQGCSQSFKDRGGLTNHVRTYHRNLNLVETPQAPAQDSSPEASSPTHSPTPPVSPAPSPGAPFEGRFHGPSPSPEPTEARTCHPKLTGIPTDENGDPLPPDAPPPPRFDAEDPWFPFKDEGGFRLADFLFCKEEMSAKKIDHLLEIWALDKAKHNDLAPFNSYTQMYSAIDAIEFGDAPWQSFSMNFSADNEHPADTPWKSATYEVWYRDPARVISNLLDNPDFDGQFDYSAFIDVDERGQRRWNDFMSGNWAWRRSTQVYEEDESREGCMLCPVVLGSDKTTVSVATGHVEYHPLYLSIGNIHNTIRRAHRNAVVPIGFVAIPKSDRKYDNDTAFRKFKRELYHSSISRILRPLRNGMVTPVVQRCPDGHFRRVIYELAAFIADYPEQVALADGDGVHLWDSYGVDNDILPFTHDFPRADIHEMLTPDLLHQVIKGTFKDHLVTWVGEYLVLEHGQKRADEILDDIDRRIAAAPSFPGLRRFPHGRRFKQWMGDDSKALMKVYLPAINGHVPDEIVQAISSFLDFCYLARCADITKDTLKNLDLALCYGVPQIVQGFDNTR
ncbi:hypothetical protein H1R20_g11456, partial [Candolleomyces eurysporus]